MTLDWSAVDALPRPMRAAMQALRLDRPDFHALGSLHDSEWRSLLDWLDRQQMTLLFGHVCAGRLPGWVAERFEGNLRANRLRRERLRQEYAAIANALRAAAIPHAVLKGFTHGPPYVPDPELRPQYDLDLLVAPADLARAQNALETLGFEPSNRRDKAPADHLPPLIRRTGWQWKGDYFDPDIPPVVELHHRLWDARTEGFDCPVLAAPGFDPSGSPAYAAAHALRHLLRGSLKTLHLYELARFLHETPGTEDADGPQAVVFGLARRWFGCSLGAGPARAVGELSPAIRTWLRHYSASPLTKAYRANKNELWLHLELIDDWRTRLRIVRRRLAPLSLPGALDGQYDRGKPTARERARRTVRYIAHASRRIGFHAVSMGKTAREAVRWSRMRRGAESRPVS